MKKLTCFILTALWMLGTSLAVAGGGSADPIVTVEGIQIGDEEPNTCCALNAVLIRLNEVVEIQTYTRFQVQTGEMYDHIKKPGLPANLALSPVDKNVLRIEKYDDATGKLFVRGLAVGVSSIFPQTPLGKLAPTRLANYTVYDPAELAQFEQSAAVFYAQRRVQPGNSLAIMAIFHRGVSVGSPLLRINTIDPDGKKSNREIPFVSYFFDEGGWFHMLADLIPEKAKQGAYWIDVALNDGGTQVARSRFMTTVGDDPFPGNLGRPELSSASLYARCCVEPVPDSLGMSGVFPERIRGRAKVYLDNQLVSEARQRQFVRRYNTNYVELDYAGLQAPVRERSVVLFFTDTGLSMPVMYGKTLLSDVDPNDVDFKMFGNQGLLKGALETGLPANPEALGDFLKGKMVE